MRETVKVAVRNSIFSAVCTVLGVALNIAGSRFAGVTNIPLYFDSIATIAVAALCGFIPSLLCAMGTNGILALFGPVAWPFMLCHVCTALFASLIFSYEKKHKTVQASSFDSFLLAGIASGVSNALLGSSFAYFVMKGNTSVSQIDTGVQGIFAATHNLAFAVFYCGILFNLVDKALSALFSYCLYRAVRYATQTAAGK